jgi:hypothetical protein
MSGAASGITKVFSSFGSGIARLGTAVKGVGASLFTGAAASGQSISGGGLGSILGGGTLGKIFGGATRVLGGPAGQLAGAVGTALPAATRGFGSYAPALVDGMTTGATTVTQSGGLFKGIGDFLGSEAGIGLVGGLVGGAGDGMQQQAILDARAEESAMARQAEEAKEQRLRDSYSVPADALPGGTEAFRDPTVRPKPAVAYARGKRAEYDPISGRIKMVDA